MSSLLRLLEFLRRGRSGSLLDPSGRMDRFAADVMVTLFGTVTAVVAVVVSQPSGLTKSLPLSLAIAVLLSLPLLARRTRPELALVTSVLATLSTDNTAPLIFSTWAVGRFGRRHRALWLSAAGAGYLITSPLVGTAPWSVHNLYYLVANIVAPGLIGDLLRRQSQLIDTVRNQVVQARAAVGQAAEYAALEERTRLAFDMHDSIGHHLTVVTLQAASVRARTDDPDAVTEAAKAAEDSARAAMAELREILDVLRRHEEEPTAPARLARVGYDAFLRTLVRNMRSMGLDVRYAVQGTRALLPISTQSLLYRIGREGLTNAIKYGPGAPIHLTLAFRPDRVDFSVENGPSLGTQNSLGSSGIGLTSLRRQVENAHGSLTASHTPQGGFLLRTWLPVATEAPGAPSLAPQHLQNEPA